MPCCRKSKPAPKPSRRPKSVDTNANKEIDLTLARRIQSGDRRALGELVLKYEAFACKMALKAQARSGLELEDLCQEARMGLTKAAERYDPERELAFTTYASWWVRHKLNRYIADHVHLLRIPVNAQIKHRKLVNHDGAEDACGLEADIIAAMRAKAVPIDTNSDFENTVPDIGDFSTGYDAENALLDKIEQHREAEWLRLALWELTERERTVLECRLLHHETLIGTAIFLHKCGIDQKRLSRERIRQIQNDALARLADMLSRDNAI